MQLWRPGCPTLQWTLHCDEDDDDDDGDDEDGGSGDDHDEDGDGGDVDSEYVHQYLI